MTTYDILISATIIIILSYVFDVFSSKTKLPSVVLLLLLGVGIKWAAGSLGVDVAGYEAKINAVLPLLGTLGLIFIVLEGALELEVDGSKKWMLIKSFAAALIILLCSLTAIWAILCYGYHQDSYLALLNAAPLSVISSTIAIPSVATLKGYEKEFVTYESAFSDILGVTIFNFVLTNNVINGEAFVHLGSEMFLVFVISIVATISLGFLFERLKQHKKFVLMLSILIFFYGVAKYFHLPALVLIFIFGLFAGNNEFFVNNLLKQKFQMSVLQKEIHQFQSFVTEFAFVIRTFFFVIFGASIKFSGLVNPENLLPASLIFIAIYLLRFLYFKVTKDDKDNLLWYVAPRGLVSILLFFSIPEPQRLQIVGKDVLLLVILASVIILALGSMMNTQKTASEPDGTSNDDQ